MAAKRFSLFIFLVFITGSWAACTWDDETGLHICDQYITWNEGGTRRSISWAEDCSFTFEKHNNLKTVSSSNKEACGELCLKERKCTHFTVTKESECRMMSNERHVASEPDKTTGFSCGFINTRTDFARVGK